MCLAQMKRNRRRCNMFDSFLIKEGSLENFTENGKVAGFKFAIHIADYRGAFLSLHNGYYIEVDGKVYPREVQKFATVLAARGICTVDSFDIHGQIWSLRSSLDAVCQANHTVSILSAGWDPGTDSMVRALLMAMSPKAENLMTRSFFIFDRRAQGSMQGHCTSSSACRPSSPSRPAGKPPKVG